MDHVHAPVSVENPADEQVALAEEPVVESLIEEVSIDGMCGVY